jgi:hypothetical protein
VGSPSTGGYRVGEQTYLNAVFGTEGSLDTSLAFDRTASQLESDRAFYTATGKKMIQLESYPGPSGVLYATIYREGVQNDMIDYRDKTASQHQSLFSTYTTLGYAPVSISVVEVNGAPRYSALYSNAAVSNLIVRSAIPLADFQTEYNANLTAGRHLHYLNGYDLNGSVYYAAIFKTPMFLQYRKSHDITLGSLESIAKTNARDGYVVKAPTGYSKNGAVRFAGMWKNFQPDFEL